MSPEKSINGLDSETESRKSEKPTATYNQAKGAYVTFGNKKAKKIKLRKYVQDKSKILSRINGFTHSHNRGNLIESFNQLGLDGINQLMKEEVDMALTKQKRFIEQRQKQELKLKQEQENEKSKENTK